MVSINEYDNFDMILPVLACILEFFKFFMINGIFFHIQFVWTLKWNKN